MSESVQNSDTDRVYCLDSRPRSPFVSPVVFFVTLPNREFLDVRVKSNKRLGMKDLTSIPFKDNDNTNQKNLLYL